MSSVIAALRMVATDLNRVGRPWALVGALGVSVHAEPRTTKDIDVAVALADGEELEHLITALEESGYGKRKVLMQSEPTYQLGFRLLIPGPRAHRIPVDLLTSSCGIEPEIIKAAEIIELLPGVILPVACLGHLLAMKVLSQNDWDRIRDKADIVALLARASSSDIAVAHEALTLITERGHNRGRALVSMLEHFLSLAA